MKVLTHNSVLLTLPFASLPEDAFARLDGRGTAAAGTVGELDERAVRRTANEAAAREGIDATANEIAKTFNSSAEPSAASPKEPGSALVLGHRNPARRVTRRTSRASPRRGGQPRRVQRHGQAQVDGQRPRHRGEHQGRASDDKARRGRSPAAHEAAGEDYPESMTASLETLDRLDAEER